MTAQHPERPAIRISDADRERAAQRLHTALSEGRITVSELEERITVVYAARFESDLVPPLADLPQDQAQAPVASTPSGPPVVLRAGMSSLRRSGAWKVPPRLRVLSGVGSVVLDFCDADNPHPVVELELEVGAGSVRLILPDNATADVDGMAAVMGTVRCKVPAGPVPGAPHFVVHGRAGMGSVTVRRRYRFGSRHF
ncbi:DUF1707 domain-containing protein [Pseudonocardia sp. GCM10023141]|uniref:DUF1707 domain-containing protein n=1 Tax=Pseudonocardia sp. GCM10023141 TaxID=3252653 RepID=UPI00360D7C17